MNTSPLLRFLIVFCLGLALLGLYACSPDHSHAADPSDDGQEATASKEYYEIRTYHLSSEDQQAKVLAYLKDAAVPGLNRQGISPVGVFTLADNATDADSGYNVYMLIPYSSMQQFAEAPLQLMADAEHNQAGAAYLDISDPENKAFDRITSSLSVAFDSMPEMAVPTLTTGNQKRIFELRSYESFSEKKGIKKVKMFNEGGEVRIFTELGFQPVFFAQAIAGDQQPNLIYMITFTDMDDHAAKWKSFVDSPDWAAVKDLPEYANTVSKIHKYFLLPTDFSQL